MGGRVKVKSKKAKVKRRQDLDLSGIKTYSIKGRKSKVGLDQFATRYKAGSRFSSFLDSLPDMLAARDLREIISAIVEAYRGNKVVAVGMGAHPTKVGLNPIVIDLMERGVISSVAVNGAVIIHDMELALAGKTSEDVDSEIGPGRFGMVEETPVILNEAIKSGVKRGLGIGEAVGERIDSADFPFRKESIVAAGYRLGIPVTVHVAIGTDIIHMHPSVDGAALGEGSIIDFRRFASVISRLDKGVYLNIGSAVIMPEVFLKALTLVRNLGHKVRNFTTVNMDFIQHYRPVTNVVKRPTKGSGRGYSLTGHHEIMFPLIAAGIIESLGNADRPGKKKAIKNN